MSLDLHKLEIFATVAHMESFTRAADQLHLTQPSVSQQLAMLEAQVGVRLIERDTRHLRLTAAGELLLTYADKLLATAREALEATRAAAGLADRTLLLGVGPTLATYVLPGVLSRFQARFADCPVRISVGNTTELLALVASQAVDLALIGLPAEHPDVVITPFMRDHLVVIVAPDDPWTRHTEVTPEDLLTRPFLTREPGSALHAAVQRLLGPAALSGDTIILLGETEAIKRSVEAGLGVALVQGIAVDREVAAGNLVALRLRGDDSRTYACARHRRRELSTAARDFVTLLDDLRSLEPGRP